MTDTLPVAEIRLTAKEFCAALFIIWGDRFSRGSQEAAEYLQMQHRNVLRLMSGEREVNSRISQEILCELRRALDQGHSAAASVVNLALEDDRPAT